MINRLILGSVVLLICIQLHSQARSPDFRSSNLQTVNLGNGTNMRTSFNVGDIMRTKVDFSLPQDPHIKGSPFYPESFSPSIIILKNGDGYADIETRMNLATNDVYFRTSDSAEFVAGKGVIKKLMIFPYTHSKSDSVVFSSGYPAIDNQNENTFYEELASGKVSFLKFTRKILNNVQSLTATPLDKQYVDITNYYISLNGRRVIERWHKGKEFIIEFLRDKEDAVQKFIETNNLKCKSEEDIEKVIQYYNNL